MLPCAHARADTHHTRARFHTLFFAPLPPCPRDQVFIPKEELSLDVIKQYRVVGRAGRGVGRGAWGRDGCPAPSPASHRCCSATLWQELEGVSLDVSLIGAPHTPLSLDAVLPAWCRQGGSAQRHDFPFGKRPSRVVCP